MPKSEPEYALVYLYGYFFRRRDDLEQLRRKWIMMMMSIKIDIRLRITPDDNKWEFQVASESGGFAEMQRFAKFACDQVYHAFVHSACGVCPLLFDLLCPVLPQGEPRQVVWRDRAWEQTPTGIAAYQQAKIDYALRMKEDGILHDGHVFVSGSDERPADKRQEKAEL